MRENIRILGQTIFLLSILGWVHVQMIITVDQSLLAIQLSHWTPWLRTDDFGILTYIGVGIGLFLWRLKWKED